MAHRAGCQCLAGRYGKAGPVTFSARRPRERKVAPLPVMLPPAATIRFFRTPNRGKLGHEDLRCLMLLPRSSERSKLRRRKDIRLLGMAKGTVKWFNTEKGYGFIQPADGGKDIFVHITAVQAAGLQSLKDNQPIEYELVDGRDGRKSAGHLRV
jgi:CspA family cold shock protein